MYVLVVKEYMRAELFQDLLFPDAAKEESLVHAHVPVAQGLDGALMGGDAA